MQALEFPSSFVVSLNSLDLMWQKIASRNFKKHPDQAADAVSARHFFPDKKPNVFIQRLRLSL